ncbi:MAG: UvrD-helicase domain-containing protein, partial [Treponema sp.]|nr:UvrD-helicase domain-containing protein [Treponema sp.]
MFPEEVKCPLCKEKFEYMSEISHTIFGHNLDFKPFGAAIIPTNIPKCPKCKFVFIDKYFKKKEIDKLKEIFEKYNFYKKEPDMPDYYYLARQCETLERKPDDIIYYFNCAIWELSTNPQGEVSRADDKKKHFRQIAEIVFEYIEKTDKENKNYIYRLIKLDYLRRLKEFSDAKKLILELVEDKTFPEKYMPVLDKQYDLIKNENTSEHEMPELKKKEDVKEPETQIKKEKPFIPIKPVLPLKIFLSETFDYGKANENQKMAISTTEGPVLITAGPGTGKTFTLVQRALLLIQEKDVKPEEILMATFTEKAAKELVTRISNTLLKKNILLNLKEMYIGTFHSICLRFIKENLEYSTIKKNYRTLDDFDQKYTIMRKIKLFENIDNFHLVIEEKMGIWDKAAKICQYVNNLSEELVDPNDLKKDSRPEIKALGEIMETYNSILDEGNLMDFSKLQTEAYNLILNNPAVLEKLQSKIKYLMIDEYQDTNYIQERIVFLLGNKSGNICVVGDDDQGLYRFRGATIRNILEFPSRFETGCVQIPLIVNYRSNSDIVGFYNDWIE